MEERLSQRLCSLFVVKKSCQSQQSLLSFAPELYEHEGMKSPTQAPGSRDELEFINHQRAIRIVLMADRGGELVKEWRTVDHLHSGNIAELERDVASFDANESEPRFAYTERSGSSTGLLVPLRESCLFEK